MIVFLIGPRGSGKTTVARLLAGRLGWDWVDADAALEERCGRSIREVFAAEGEEGFRRHESAVLADLARREDVVIATGGGVILREDNRQVLKHGKVVWLTADAETLWRRVSQDPSTGERRPALVQALGLDGRAGMEQVLGQREPLYRACADLVLDTSGRTPEEVAALAFSFLRGDEPNRH